MKAQPKSTPSSAQPQRDEVVTETGPKKTYGKHATMPVRQADCYAEIALPNLPEWDPMCELEGRAEEGSGGIKLDATVVAVGKRRTGKSWAFRNLMWLLRKHIPAGIVISQTDELNKYWRDYVPKQFIFPKYEPEILDAVFKRQKAILNDKNMTKSEKEKKAPFFVLLDDVISDQRLKYDENLMELFVAGRHYKLFVLITTQYAKAITPTLRGNTDFCLIMKTIQGRQREALWEDFGDFLTKDAFNRIVDAYTEDNEILVVNTCPELHVDPMEMLSWWKAQEIAPFKMGSKQYWESAMNADQKVPPKEGPDSASQFLGVKDIMPPPWDQFV